MDLLSRLVNEMPDEAMRDLHGFDEKAVKTLLLALREFVDTVKPGALPQTPITSEPEPQEAIRLSPGTRGTEAWLDAVVRAAAPR